MSPLSDHRASQPRYGSSRSFLNVLSKLSCSLFTTSHDTPPPRFDPSGLESRKAISHPRQLRRNLANGQSTLYIHPIQTLPVEILTMIIQSGTDEDVYFPITFSHVCRYWRHISLQTPSIWRRIALSSQNQMWSQRIQRAQGCSLDVELCSSRQTRSGALRVQDLNPYSVNWYMQLVQPYVQQWRSLNIHFTEYSPYMWKAALVHCDCPAPMLEELALVYRHNDDMHEFLPFMGYTPRLRRVTIDGIRLLWIPSMFCNLTYLNYTHHGLTSGHQSVQDVISILAISSRLTELRILFPRGQIARIPPSPPSKAVTISLPRLKQLHLVCDGSDIPFELAHLVTLMTTPTLTSLHLIDLTRSHQPFLSLKSFFYVYALPPSLKFVSVAHGWYDPKMILAMSQSMPHLVSIHVKKPRRPDQVLKMKPRAKPIPSYSSVSKPVLVHGSKGSYYINHLDVHYIPGYKDQ